jgi:hypothetical protein
MSSTNENERAYRRMFNAWNAGKYAVALELSRKFVEQFPGHHVGRVLRGVILFEMSRYEEARTRPEAGFADSHRTCQWVTSNEPASIEAVKKAPVPDVLVTATENPKNSA